MIFCSIQSLSEKKTESETLMKLLITIFSVILDSQIYNSDFCETFGYFFMSKIYEG